MGSKGVDTAEPSTNSFLMKEDPVVNPPFAQLLTEYSNIPKDKLVQHVKEVVSYFPTPVPESQPP